MVDWLLCKADGGKGRDLTRTSQTVLPCCVLNCCTVSRPRGVGQSEERHDVRESQGLILGLRVELQIHRGESARGLVVRGADRG